MEAVEKYTSSEFQTSHMTYPNNQLPPVSSTLALNVIAQRATKRSANARETT